jgi:hypothetical protein
VQTETQNMFVRENLREKKKLSLVAAAVFLLLAGAGLAYQYWPEKKANLSQAYFSDDDGQSWFIDDTTKLAPFDHNGKTALMAEIFTYDNGSKKFCGYLEKYTPEAKAKLEAAMADARAHGQSPSSIELFHDHNFMNSACVLKKPGAGNPWIAFTDANVGDVINVHSPDGSAVDQYFVY